MQRGGSFLFVADCRNARFPLSVDDRTAVLGEAISKCPASRDDLGRHAPLRKAAYENVLLDRFVSGHDFSHAATCAFFCHRSGFSRRGTCFCPRWKRPSCRNHPAVFPANPARPEHPPTTWDRAIQHLHPAWNIQSPWPASLQASARPGLLNQAADDIQSVDPPANTALQGSNSLTDLWTLSASL